MNIPKMKLPIIGYCNILIIMLIFFIIPFLASPVSSANLTDWLCLDEIGNYTANSTYHDNLKVTLVNLTSQASLTDFGTHTAGQGNGTVHGLFICRGDLNLEECHECLQEASRSIINRCPTQMAAVIWYEDCLLRYANNSEQFSNEMVLHTNAFWSDQKYSNPQRLTEVLADTFENMFKKAAYDDSTRGYVVAEASLSETHTVYCRVQCTPDILGDLCASCLDTLVFTVKGCCGTVDHMSLKVISPSCYAQYNVKALPTTPAQPPSSVVKGSGPSSHQRKTQVITTVVVPIVAAGLVLVVLLSCTYWFYMHKKKKRKLATPPVLQEVSEDLDELSVPDSVQYNFNEIQTATNNFSSDNKLGQGGFGSVYKGKLANGQDIAVKRLSMFSGQGFKEFKTEVLLDMKLQHKNLVRLLGFCVDKEEKLLIYEYLPNSSLDKFLFDREKRALLDWSTRYKIIIGIARGLLYLHEDSRLTIVHRDLKCGNILLDEAMNPKLADFGMARLFDTAQIHASTKVIVGTYGYMAPEYAMHGHFSTKSDVYSFGMIVLEILSGQRCTLNNQSDHQESLLHRAWVCWSANQPLSLVDKSLTGNISVEEVTKCIQIGLLCVQEEVAKRPTMSRILNVINGHSTVNLPEPAPPLMPQSTGPEVVIPGSVPSEDRHIIDVSSSSHDLSKFSGTAEISDILPR